MKMKRVKLLLIVALITLMAVQSSVLDAQSFEGRVIYQVSYESKIAEVSNEEMNTFMGGDHEYYLKGGDYKMLSNGEFFESQLYIHAENSVYNKTAQSDTLYWIDGSFEDTEVKSYRFLDETANVLGYECKVLEVIESTGKTTYYFNEQFALDPEYYSNHSFGNWSFVIGKTKSLLLKFVSEREDYTVTSTAVRIEPMKLSESMFQLQGKNPVKPMPGFY